MNKASIFAPVAYIISQPFTVELIASRYTVDPSGPQQLMFSCPRFGAVCLDNTAVIRIGGVPLIVHGFRDLTLAEAETSLVAGCLDHSHAIEKALTLPWRFFRSEQAAELERIFYVLAVWYRMGAFDDATNRDRLAALSPADADWIQETLFDGNAAVPAYIDALVEALRETYEAQDRAVEAARDLGATPIPTTFAEALHRPESKPLKPNTMGAFRR